MLHRKNPLPRRRSSSSPRVALLGAEGEFVAPHLNIPDVPQQQPPGSAGLGDHNGVRHALDAGEGTGELHLKAAVGHGLDDVVKGLDLVPLHSELGHVGHEDQGDLLIHLPQPPGGLHAVHVGQLDIHEHQVVHRAVVFQKVHRLAEVGDGGFHPLAVGKAVHVVLQLSGGLGVVLDDGDTQHRPLLSPADRCSSRT